MATYDESGSLNRIDTPWGEVDLVGVERHRQPIDGQASASVMVDTPAGRASLSFHVDPEDGDVPESLRLVLTCDYDAADRAVVGARSLVTVGGAPAGWRMQAYLDPATGLPAGTPASVMLVAQGGKIVRGFDKVEARVVAQAMGALDAVREETPAYAASIYAALVRRTLPSLDLDVEAAEQALRDARSRRDRAQRLIDAAEEVTQEATLPSPGH